MPASHVDPVVRTHLLIRAPAAAVYKAFVDPAVTSRFWFTRGSGRLDEHDVVTWHWDMYGASARVEVVALERDRRIAIAWPTPVEWVLTRHGSRATFVEITATGFEGSAEERVARAIDAMGGFSFVLAGCKAWLEHGIALGLTRDHDPGSHVERGSSDAGGSLDPVVVGPA